MTIGMVAHIQAPPNTGVALTRSWRWAELAVCPTSLVYERVRVPTVVSRMCECVGDTQQGPTVCRVQMFEHHSLPESRDRIRPHITPDPNIYFRKWASRRVGLLKSKGDAMKAGLTQEETTFLRTLYSSSDDSDDAPGDCMECGDQIDSARQIKYEGAILCAKCAAKLAGSDTCIKIGD